MDKIQVRKEQELEMLSQMLLIRRFEERAAQQYQRGDRIGGFCHLYIGQEAVITGSVAATRPDDYLITAYRDHGHALARGTSADSCMAELFGKATGCSKGLGGSMHYFDKERFMYGGHAIIGQHLPLATGLAFASKYRGENRVTLCYMGDGAINIGSFHEALNMAGIVQAAGHFHLREQLLFHGHARPPFESAQGNRQPRARLRHAQRGDRRHGRPRGARRPGGHRGNGPPTSRSPTGWKSARTVTAAIP